MFRRNLLPAFCMPNNKPCMKPEKVDDKLKSKLYSPPTSYWFLVHLPHIRWRWKRYVPPKRRVLSKLYYLTIQRTVIFIVSAARKSSSTDTFSLLSYIYIFKYTSICSNIRVTKVMDLYFWQNLFLTIALNFQWRKCQCCIGLCLIFRICKTI
jgi:hypothetical protein